MNPLAFALYREIAASILLFLGVFLQQKQHEQNSKNNNNHHNESHNRSFTSHIKRFIILGALIFGNQAAFIIGLKLAGSVAAAVWQPSQPILTAAICMCLGWEAPDMRRITGVLVAFAGCAFMVVLSTKAVADDVDNLAPDDVVGTTSATSVLVGSFFFFINCLCTSLYIILSKAVLNLYPSLTVTAWSYTIAAGFMAVAAFLVSLSSGTMAVLCPDCVGPWHFPSGALFAMAYFVVFVSVMSYSMITWANQHVTGTLVMGYSVLQPVTAAILTVGLLGMGVYPTCAEAAVGSACLDPPGWGTILGMVGVFCGLSLIISTEPRKKVNERESYKPVSSDEAIELAIMNQPQQTD
jgi:drug/metabolite transporter (DMT)-like permease